MRFVRSSLVPATAASLTSVAALAIASRIERKGAFQPLNATSHWLNGDQAAAVTDVDVAHTGLGFATHWAATLFWAIPLGIWNDRARRTAFLPTTGRAFAISAIAVFVDYRLTPKRFTPGWELVLTKRSIAVAYVAMAVGLAAGSAAI